MRPSGVGTGIFPAGHRLEGIEVEQAALPSGVIYTNAAIDAEASNVEPMDTVETTRGTWMSMSYGSNVN